MVASARVACDIVGLVERSRLGLVRCKDAEHFAWALLHFDLGDAGPHALDVARERVLEQVLPRTVQPLLLCQLGPFSKGVPCQLVDLFTVHAMRVGHYDVYVVARVPDVIIDKQPLCVPYNKISDSLYKLVAWPRVAAASADVGLDGAQCNSHTEKNSFDIV